MKKIIIIVFIALLVTAAPATLVIMGFTSPPQFDETYYGQLSRMYDRIRSEDEKKIVIISNSAVAFGIRSDLLEQELSGSSVCDELRGMKVVNFGLYGAIGTKAMLELSKSNINEGDIVIISPEMAAQSMSLYFSASEFWRAADSDFSMLSHIPLDHSGALAGDYLNYVSEKYKYINEGRKPSASGAYTQGAFNNKQGEEVGYMTYDRAYNIMLGGYDSINTVVMDKSIIGDGFIDYINDYAGQVKKKGAAVYFGFTPINVFALPENYTEALNNFYDFLADNLKFEMIGHPLDYVLDYDWFYDNNVHMNSAGMYVYTYILCESIKNKYADSSPINIAIPEKPVIPVNDVTSGDNSDADLFTYETTVHGISLTGLTDEGKKRASVTVPSSYDGVGVVSFAASVFAGNATINEIIIPANIREIKNNSFDGCIRLTRIIMQHENLITCSAGDFFLAGARADCYVYVTESAYNVVNGCAGGWLNYSGRIRMYS